MKTLIITYLEDFDSLTLITEKGTTFKDAQRFVERLLNISNGYHQVEIQKDNVIIVYDVVLTEVALIERDSSTVLKYKKEMFAVGSFTWTKTTKWFGRELRTIWSLIP